MDPGLERTAFVLAGGGSLGAVQAGMLVELMAANVCPDLIVGVSAGALNGAFFAFDPSVAMVERIADLWRRVTTRVPLNIVATDEITGAEVILSQGDVVDAVLAGSAIPGVFAPVSIGGRGLVDGAIASGTPIAAAAHPGAACLIVVPCGFTCVDSAIPRHALGRAMHAVSLLGARQLRQDCEHFGGRLALRFVPPLCPLHYSPYDYSNGALLIEAARESTRRWLGEGGLECPDLPGAMLVHTHRD